VRLVAFQRPVSGEGWGLADDDGAVWDACRATGRDLGGAQHLLCALGPKRFLAALGAEATLPRRDLSLAELAAGGQLRLPWRPPEVWAAGVTYRVSEDARTRESEGSDLYRRVYAAERPELFLKAAAGRAAGPGDPVGLRPDSVWQVPEPELAVIADGRGGIAGYLCGNDLSCRDIEGANALYLPQAKIYDGSLSLGPTVLLAGADAWRGRRIGLEVVRGGRIAFAGLTATDRLARSPAELLSWLGRAYRVVPGTVLLTGTGIVPPDDFSLADGDEVRVWIDGIGTLTNVCRVLPDRRPVSPRP
jgi:2-dehydro-3-deoxy-D-arabinonate dehydratase